jgi:hypothetical protein
MTRRAACAVAGIHHTQLYRWMHASAPFRTAIEKAEGRAEATFSARVSQAAGKGTWQAAAWWLERRRPEEYARRQQVDFRFELEAEIRKLALEAGVDAKELLAEAERIVRGLER